MKLSRLVLVVLCALPMLTCSSGGECDECNTDDDCEQGLVCSRFNDDSMRCGSGEGVTSCRTLN